MSPDQSSPGNRIVNRYEREPATTGQVARRERHRARTFQAAQWFDDAREKAEQYPCPPAPHGCAAPAGYTCHLIGFPDLELTALPAHLRRMSAAGVVPWKSTVGNGARRDTDRDPAAPKPAVNREPGTGGIRETHEPGWTPRPDRQAP